MSNIETDVMNYIASNSSFVINTDLFINFLPETSSTDNIIVLFTYANSPQELALDDQYFNFQCRVRDVDYDTCRDRAIELHKILNRTGTTSLEGRRIVFKPSQSPSFLMFDESDRVHFVFNFTALVEGY